MTIISNFQKQIIHDFLWSYARSVFFDRNFCQKFLTNNCFEKIKFLKLLKSTNVNLG